MKKYIYLITTLLLFAACEKLDIKRQVIFSKAITFTEVKTTSARAAANLLDNGGSNISKIGFVFSASPSPTFESAEGKAEVSSAIAANRPIPLSTVLSNLKGGTKYFVRAYAFNEAGIVGYSEENTFTTTNVPEITSTLPLSVEVGTEITLNGANFGNNPILTLQGGTVSPPLIRPSVATDTRIVFRVPLDMAAGSYSIIINNGQANSSGNISLNIVPTISGYNETAFIGEEWSINGTGFGTEPTAVKVSLGTTNLTIVRIEPTRVTAALPKDVTGTFKPSVTVNSRTATGTRDLTLRPTANAWIRKGLMPIPNHNGVQFTYNGSGYAGLDNNKNLYEYNPTTDKWVIKSMTYPGTLRWAAGWAMIGTKLYFGSGRKATEWSDELYEFRATAPN